MSDRSAEIIVRSNGGTHIARVPRLPSRASSTVSDDHAAMALAKKLFGKRAKLYRVEPPSPRYEGMTPPPIKQMDLSLEAARFHQSDLRLRGITHLARY